jgi:hypothetical protein
MKQKPWWRLILSIAEGMLTGLSVVVCNRTPEVMFIKASDTKQESEKDTPQEAPGSFRKTVNQLNVVNTLDLV